MKQNGYVFERKTLWCSRFLQAMNIQMFIVVAVTFLSLATWALPFGTYRVGTEFEYEGQGRAKDNSDPKNYETLLKAVQSQFGGGQIDVQPWNKYSNAMGTFYASMTDSKGRHWEVAPEIMNNGLFDGYELVTPPLETAEDGKQLEQVLDRISRTGLFKEGYSSSTHYTFDVSHLMTKKKNVSRLVDLILFIESNLPKIYQALGPQRYGHVVNRYAVPLALDQKDLLKELAELPVQERTYKKVREIFLKYDAREMELTGGNKVRAWKFRAVNYGKFFGLGYFEHSKRPVLEFRIGDLVQDSQVVKNVEFLSSVIEVGSKKEGIRFQDPFPGFLVFEKDSKEHKKLDQSIRALPAKDYFEFLEQLSLDGLKHPPRYHQVQNRCDRVYSGH